jgi:dTMP kinase
MLWEIGRLATGGLEPALTFVLDLPVETACTRRRGPADRIESRGAIFEARVREGFLIEARRNPESIRVIDASQPVDKVHDEIRRVVTSLL